jgi:hypothetical protein
VYIIPATAETSGHGTTESQPALYADRLAEFLAAVPKMWHPTQGKPAG